MINGKVELLQDVTDDFFMYITLFNLDAGQYKKYFIEKNFTNLCTSAFEDPLLKDAVKRFIAHTEPKIEFGKCPGTAGVYDTKNLMLEDSYLPPYISMASEKWRGDLRLYKNGEFQGGVVVYGLLRNADTLMNLGG